MVTIALSDYLFTIHEVVKAQSEGVILSVGTGIDSSIFVNRSSADRLGL